MPKRKIDLELPTGEQRAAFRKVLDHPLPPMQRERRPVLMEEPHEYIATVRRGRIVYREHGKAGADYRVPPYYWRMRVARRNFEAACAKVERQLLGIHKARHALHTKAQATAEHIRELARIIPTGRGQIKAIARAAGVNVRTVWRALRARP